MLDCCNIVMIFIRFMQLVFNKYDEVGVVVFGTAGISRVCI